MSTYTIVQGSDTKWYLKTHKDGTGSGPSAPTDTISAAQNTIALAQALMTAAIFTECNYSESANF